MFLKRYGIWILLAVAIVIRIFSSYPAAVETYYTQGIYPYIGQVQRFLLGWLPFSLGDLLYAAAVIFLLMGVVRFTKRLLKRRVDRAYLLATGRRTLLVILWVYVLFNVLWGLNYNRQGIAQQLDLKVTAYTQDELVNIINLTIDKLHAVDSPALEKRPLFARKQVLFEKAVTSYREVERTIPFLKYERPSIKPSIFSYLGNYLGYTGYYNPFTGEAQVNTAVPLFLQSFTTSHEIGHQLGYAKENEANFAGYLAARASPDPAVQYSIYLDLYMYASRNLWEKDSTLARSLQQKLPPITRNDLLALRKFYKDYENPFEPIIRRLYGQYLRANQQPQGILSYDEVIAWVIAYHRKYRQI
jgi:hypothetical protein